MFRKAFLISLLGLLLVAVGSVAFAADGATTGGGLDLPKAAAYLGLGIAALGGGLGQGKAIAAALEGIARNPSAQDKIFTPMIVGLALIESLVIYALVIAFVKG